MVQDHDSSPKPPRRNLPAAHALVRCRTRDTEQRGNLGDGVGPSAVGHRFRSGRRTPGVAQDSAPRSGCWGNWSNDRCAVHGVDRAQVGLIESLPRPHTRSLPPSAGSYRTTPRTSPVPPPVMVTRSRRLLFFITKVPFRLGFRLPSTAPVSRTVKGQLFLPVGGQWFCPLVAISFAL